MEYCHQLLSISHATVTTGDKLCMLMLFHLFEYYKTRPFTKCQLVLWQSPLPVILQYGHFVFYNSAVGTVTELWATCLRNCWFAARARDLSFLQSIQSSSVAHPTSCPRGIRVISLRVKGRSVPMIMQPHLIPRLRMSITYTFRPYMPTSHTYRQF